MGRFIVFCVGTATYVIFIYSTLQVIYMKPSMSFFKDFYIAHTGISVCLVILFYIFIIKSCFSIYNEFIDDKEQAVRQRQYARDEEQRRADEEARKRAEEEEEARRQKNLDFELAKKRQELELELEHYKQMALINASIDEGKLQYLEKMKKKAKKADLKEIQKMQKMLEDLE